MNSHDDACFSNSSAAGEKRKPSEPLPHEQNKRPRVVGDIPMDLINEVMATIADPAAVPEVRSSHIHISKSHMRRNLICIRFSCSVNAAPDF